MDFRTTLRRLLGLEGDQLVQTEKVVEPWRYVPFDPRLPSTLPAEMGEPTQSYTPGTFDSMAKQMGYASDDPYQLGAKLEAWKDHQRLKDKLSR
jgi:hypothetical protein